MLTDTEHKLARDYAPRLLFDLREPFFPVRFGVTILHEGGPSPSFRRQLTVKHPVVNTIIEYAIYYDYDIQHLYDLEHVWVYIGHDGELIDVEASFHGKYLKGVLPDRSNLSGRRATLYVQPGKHALSPLPEVFRLLPGFAACAQEEAGADGLIYGDFLSELLYTDEKMNTRVRRFLQTFRFEPSLCYREWLYADRDELFVSWNELLTEIPARVQRELGRL